MYEIDLESVVEDWLGALPYRHYQRVMRNADDYLVTGGVPDGDHVKKLQGADGVFELRVPLDRTTWRITFWKPGGQVIILLTVFRKTRDGVQKSDVDRAIRAMRICQKEHDMTITHDFERNELWLDTADGRLCRPSDLRRLVKSVNTPNMSRLGETSSSVTSFAPFA